LKQRLPLLKAATFDWQTQPDSSPLPVRRHVTCGHRRRPTTIAGTSNAGTVPRNDLEDQIAADSRIAGREQSFLSVAESHEQAVMLGDSLDRDVDGALSAGLHAIWVNRLGHPRPANRQEVVEVSTLDEAVATLSTAAWTGRPA
jgi:hypothetical protein